MKKARKRHIIITVIFLFGLAWFYAIYESITLPDTIVLKDRNPTTTAYMERFAARNPKVRIQWTWVPYNRISVNLKEAVLAAEDDDFFEHKGFDVEAIKKAAIYDWKKKRFARGASTITQQLARNLYLTPSKNPMRKLKELLIALKLERELSKQRILELYLNVVEWGKGIYGCEAASRYYFKKSTAALSAPEAAFMASILPSPRKLGKRNPYDLTPRAEKIKNIID